MKKFITLTLAAVLLIAALCAAHKPFRTVTDYADRTWQFTGCEDYCTGDLVALTMSDNGTRNTVLDDEIMQARYVGDLESWYKYGGAK